MEEIELNGIERMKQLNLEFLASGKGTDLVRNFMRKIGEDEDLMEIYLKGRKYRPDFAWKTILRHAEVRFNDYPEVFPEVIPDYYYDCIESGLIGVLKTRDRLGRRIIVFDSYKWNPKEIPMLGMTVISSLICEKLLHDEDAVNNGVILIENCDNLGLSHAKYYTLHAMLRFLHVFWYACPLKFKGFYFVNVPVYLTFIYDLIKPFFSKKIKERLWITTKGKKFQALEEHFAPDVLPESLGGTIPDNEALDMDIVRYD